MILSDKDIKKALEAGRIKITPEPNLEVQLGSCSIDLHLGDKFRVFKNSSIPFIDLRKNIEVDQFMDEVEITDDRPFIMQPGSFALANTMESLELADDILGRIEGRSSLGRLGIIVHGTASVFDPGWIGYPTMELGNLGTLPVALYPGMRICAFTFEEVSSKVDVPYRKKKGNKYAGQKTPLASKLNQEM
ncbi:MAG: dCTP deaminase [Candidatus Doudnabacteria bacterium RIFCSPHIGHO2_12_FULL_48_11]|uniref:dCTP deaminase n=1 Tax=Candidatus Doudnabacteria bacterium RIFCSPHIGHO2_01_FULL_46_24 TaxID=1817825 RepID=A0A1F5NTW2_9BACT|nr:MAG: dCTP deaminase [Candidatus Doudnabacteria bacterium RIFCSPHIGHO2_01_FULL_46_24]OGE95475.1 MAG: dCTP deaminase [Candidatus Doudnabacteria bacterium RIFCSPHIGHO2_12_FULL_48_11]